VKIDLEPPALAVSSPALRAVQKEASAAITGTVEEGATVTIDGTSVPTASGAWTSRVTLAEGPNAYQIVAEDEAGRTTVLPWHLLRDSLPPVVSLESPVADFTTTETTVMVRGLASPGSNITVNGFSVPVDPSGSFSVSVVLKSGSNTIAVVATDADGDNAQVTRVVRRVAPPADLSAASQSAMNLALVALLLAAIGIVIGLLILRKLPPGGPSATTPGHARAHGLGQARTEGEVASFEQPPDD